MQKNNAIDVDLLIEKLLKLPADADVTDRVVLDSIFAVDESATNKLSFLHLQPSNGSISLMSGIPSDARLSDIPYTQ